MNFVGNFSSLPLLYRTGIFNEIILCRRAKADSNDESHDEAPVPPKGPSPDEAPVPPEGPLNPDEAQVPPKRFPFEWY